MGSLGARESSMQHPQEARGGTYTTQLSFSCANQHLVCRELKRRKDKCGGCFVQRSHNAGQLELHGHVLAGRRLTLKTLG